ncbi:hypothetical protein [Nesterenkonia suensis]
MSETEQSPNFPKTQEELDRIIQERVASKNRRIQELEADLSKVSSERDAARSDVAARDESIQALEKDKGALSREVLVTRVAHEKGVPARWLSGEDEDSLRSSADDWLSDARGVGGATNEPPGDPGGTGDGATTEPPHEPVPSAGTGGEKPPRPSYDEVKQRAYERAKNL